MQHYFQYIKNYLNVSFEEIVTWLALRLQLKESFSHISSCLLFSLQGLIWLHVILILSSGTPFSDHFSFGYTTTVKKHYNEILIFLLANDLHLS